MFQNISLSAEAAALSKSLLAQQIAPRQELHTADETAATAAQDEAREAIAVHFGVKVEDVGSNLSLEIYPTVDGDYLAFIGDVLIEKQHQTGGGSTQLFEVVVDAKDMTVISQCLVGGFNERILSLSSSSTTTTTTTANHSNFRSLRTNSVVGGAPTHSGKTFDTEKHAINISCGRCAQSLYDEIIWSTEDGNGGISCPLQSIYLSNTNKTVPCISGVDREGRQVFGPGPIHSSFWAGTYNCHSTTSVASCRLTPFPEGCNDAINDVQYVAARTMQFLENHLGVLSEDVLIRDPKPIKAYVHYGTEYCNAMFRGREGTLYFGDCDCQGAGAMASLDIIAHEISHFLTWHTSRLASGFLSGGLNEGYADILGTIMEFVIDDSFDKPDFNIGESTGIVMRSMEYPNTTFDGLDSVCNFDIHNNTSVHVTSGPLNKAFVLSVRS